MRRSPEGPRPASQGGRKLLYRTIQTLDHHEKPIGQRLEIEIIVRVFDRILGEPLLHRVGKLLDLKFGGAEQFLALLGEFGTASI